MKVGFFSRYKFFVIAAFFLLATVVSFYAAALSAKEAAAVSYSNGYFYGRSAPLPHYNVLNDGIPAYTDKEGLINYIYTKYRSAPGSADQIGASYIIQTMRGRQSGLPNDADFNDWAARVRNPNVTYDWGIYNTGRNSARFYNGGRDVTEYNGDGTNWLAMRFYYNGNLAYVIKQICGNPLGQLGGLPVPLNYNLVPTITGTPAFTDGDSTGTDKATLNPAVNNTGSTASSNNAQWRVVTFKVPPGAAVPGGGVSGSAPEQFYGHGATAIANGTGVTFPRNVTNLSVAKQVIGDFPIGTRICYALSVQPITQSNGAWRHSTPFCVTIAKSPKFQVHGGDIRVGSNFVDQTATNGSNITTSQTTKSR